ncbi:hypothetical protein [Reichenbachiella sp.]|uniref:hypothetical protein n=1 Tax=Reichenbachiella sp. TaxID=2184521 RepID=UPI003B5C02ED
MIGITKKDYWLKWEISELIDDLKLVEKIIDKKYGKESFNHSEQGDAHADLIGVIDEIEYGNRKDLLGIYELFCINKKLPQLIGEEGRSKVNRIIGRVTKWKKYNS